MGEYKVEMKCAWTAESSRMKGSVQLGLVCLSLLISSLHGEEVKTDLSMRSPTNFEEQDLHQLEIHRVRRQTVSTEMENTDVIASPSEVDKVKRKGKGKRPRPGVLSPIADSGFIPMRSKRQERSKKKQKPRRPRLGTLICLGSSRGPQNLHQTAHVKMEKNVGGH